MDFVGSAPVQFILINVSELQSGQSQLVNVSLNDSSVVQSSNITTTSLGISLVIAEGSGLVVHSRPYVFSVAAGNSIGVGHFSEQSEPASLGETFSLCARELVLCVCMCVCVCVHVCLHATSNN